VSRYNKAKGVNNKEINTVALNKNARFKVALIYPNTYSVGMSNLGFQTIYYQLNKRQDTLCERFFYERGKKEFLSIETKNSLRSFDILAFSISFELDYFNVLNILRDIELCLDREGRPHMPLIVAGGIVNSFNFLPVSKFSDAVFVGEAEESLAEFMDGLTAHKHINSKPQKDKVLAQLAQIKGVFIPGISNQDLISARYIEDVTLYPASTKILSPGAEFSNTFLVEVSRGCPWQCYFCVTAAVGGRFRPQRLDILKKEIDFGLQYTAKIGLVGTAVSDHPEIDNLIFYLKKRKARISVSSLRVETVKANLLTALAAGGQRTVTFAPEAGSESLRFSLNKKITDQEILDKITLAKECGIKKIKLYFMIGLPNETEQDIEAIINLTELAACILPVNLNIGIFVPKPKTPWANERFADRGLLATRLKYLKRNLQGKRIIKVNSMSLKQAMQESLLAFADENFLDKYLASSKG